MWGLSSALHRDDSAYPLSSCLWVIALRMWVLTIPGLCPSYACFFFVSIIFSAEELFCLPADPSQRALFHMEL